MRMLKRRGEERRSGRVTEEPAARAKAADPRDPKKRVPSLRKRRKRKRTPSAWMRIWRIAVAAAEFEARDFLLWDVNWEEGLIGCGATASSDSPDHGTPVAVWKHRQWTVFSLSPDASQ